MARELKTETLKAAAKHYAGLFLRDAEPFPRAWVMREFHNFTFKDEFEYLINAIRGQLGPDALADFEARGKSVFDPRSDKLFAELLANKLAITPDGEHIPGKIGTTTVGGRVVGKRLTRHGAKNAAWPVYAGEEAERALGNVRPVGTDAPGADPIPPEDTLWPDETMHMGYSQYMALNTNVSIAFALAALDPALDLLDEGSLGGVIKGWTTAQPADPDVAIGAQTLLFTLTCSTTAFAAAADQTPDAQAAASTITDDSAADATDTLAFCRASSSNVADTALNDHIDGEAGTSGADFNFNTLAIVSGATVSMTSWTVKLPQGPTAT